MIGRSARQFPSAILLITMPSFFLSERLEKALSFK